jgi:tetratricopeptide (TPR) repeat protein
MLQRALQLPCRLSPALAAELMIELGSAYRDMGDFDNALSQYSSALDVMQQYRDRATESDARSGLGATLAAIGDHVAAFDQYQRAWELVEHTDARLEQARALCGMATALEHWDAARARDHWRCALALYEQLSLPGIEAIHARLAAYSPQGDERAEE